MKKYFFNFFAIMSFSFFFKNKCLFMKTYLFNFQVFYLCIFGNFNYFCIKMANGIQCNYYIIINHSNCSEIS